MLKESGKPDSFLLEYMVSMPYVGRNSFLPHPSGNPVFLRVVAIVFASIFQNILTISKKDSKMGRTPIVFFEIHFYESNYSIIIPYSIEETMIILLHF